MTALALALWASPALAQDPDPRSDDTFGQTPPVDPEFPSQPDAEEPDSANSNPGPTTPPADTLTPPVIDDGGSGERGAVVEDALPSGPRYQEFGCGPDIAGDRYEDFYFVCVDTRDGRIAFADILPSYGKPLLPNRPIMVRVIHESTHKVSVTSTGKIGLYAPGVDSGSTPGRGAGSDKVFGAGREYEAPIEWITTQVVIPPMQPGRASVTVKLFEDGAALDQINLEFVVMKTYSGALRTGISAVSLGAVDGRFALRQFAGSPQPEVVAEPVDPFNLEFVVGYAAFLEDGGRPEIGCKRAPWCFAPYLGVGLLSQDNRDNFKFLSSVHLGIEIEPVKHFSIAATLVGRRVTRLANGYQVGGPAEPGAQIETQRYGLGAGLVFNVSPTFFNFAAGGIPGSP